MTTNSRIIDESYETVQGGHNCGFLDKRRMEEFDAMKKLAVFICSVMFLISTGSIATAKIYERNEPIPNHISEWYGYNATPPGSNKQLVKIYLHSLEKFSYNDDPKQKKIASARLSISYSLDEIDQNAVITIVSLLLKNDIPVHYGSDIDNREELPVTLQFDNQPAKQLTGYAYKSNGLYCISLHEDYSLEMLQKLWDARNVFFKFQRSDGSDCRLTFRSKREQFIFQHQEAVLFLD